MFHFNQDNRTFIEHIWMNSLGIIFQGVMFCVFCVSIAGAQVPFPEIPEAQDTMASPWPNTILPLPPAPDYDSIQCWAKIPLRELVDAGSLGGNQISCMELPEGRRRTTIPPTLRPGEDADIFFIHPTMLLEGPLWNADVYDDAMNAEVDNWPIRHQASAFSEAGECLPRDTGKRTFASSLLATR